MAQREIKRYGWFIKCPYLQKSEELGVVCSITGYQVESMACVWCGNCERKVELTEV